jgi:pyrroloquinoline quinone biosynthesis protein B
MHIHVLGAGAGGGFPQWNCNCRNCHGIRSGEIRALPRTQSSITVSPDGLHWVLLNASPDLRQQIAAFPPLQPARTLRDTGITAVLLVDAQIDHTTGLALLRENQRPLDVYCTDLVRQDLSTGYPMLRLLEYYCGIHWHPVPLYDGPAAKLTPAHGFTVAGAEGLLFTAIPLKSEAPPYSPRRHRTEPGDNIGLRIDCLTSGRNLFYAPGFGVAEPQAVDFMAAADCLLVDGTVWTDDELPRQGIGTKRALEMGHLPLSGADGTLALLREMRRPRKILIHINNTNPILDEDSPERAELARLGVEVAFDGLAIEL